MIAQVLESERQRGRISELETRDRVDAVSIQEIGVPEAIGVFRHGAEADRSRRSDRQAELRRSPLVVVRAELQREIRGRAALGPSRDQVDDAACAAATKQDGGRALDDLDALDVVEIAKALLVVPDAVDEEVRGGADTPQHDLIAIAFTLRDRYARYVAGRRRPQTARADRREAAPARR